MPTTAPTTTPAPPVSDVAAVFLAVLGGEPDPGSSDPGTRMYIRDHTVCSQLLRQPPCPPVLIPHDVRDQIVDVLGPQVVFTPSPPTRLSPGRAIAVTLGAPKIDGDRASVSVETNCGPLCGLGETVVLTRTSDGWKRTGTTGSSWIS